MPLSHDEGPHVRNIPVRVAFETVIEERVEAESLAFPEIAVNLVLLVAQYHFLKMRRRGQHSLSAPPRHLGAESDEVD